ncbi:MAG: Ig-like domain-containing protein, partial [Euryarchaeota archaeon]|nr:Ig-like domain-containing protein [Euryarchaeota archaeon]
MNNLKNTKNIVKIGLAIGFAVLFLLPGPETVLGGGDTESSGIERIHRPVPPIDHIDESPEDPPPPPVNNSPLPPSLPSGPTSGYIRVPYSFSTSTTDPENDAVSYGWDWNDDMIVDDWTSWYASGDPATTSHFWNGPGTYNVRVKAKDYPWLQESSWSEPLIVFMEDHQPYTPYNSSPANQSTGVSISEDLNWTSGDPYVEDTVYYDVYFGTSSAYLSKKKTHQPGTTYIPYPTMSNNVTYYWQIVATDNYGLSNTSPIWHFTTARANNLSNPFPHDDHYEDSPADLTWSDSDASLTYDVYFSWVDPFPLPLPFPLPNPPLQLLKMASNQTGRSYHLWTLRTGVTYYWQIVAWKGAGASTVGPLWHFHTKSGGPCNPCGAEVGFPIENGTTLSNCTQAISSCWYGPSLGAFRAPTDGFMLQFTPFFGFGPGDFGPRKTDPVASSSPLVSADARYTPSLSPYQEQPTLNDEISLITGQPMVQETDFELPFGGATFRHVRTYSENPVVAGIYNVEGTAGNKNFGGEFSYWDWNGHFWMMGENPIFLIDANYTLDNGERFISPDIMRCYFIPDAHHAIPFPFDENQGEYIAADGFDAILEHNGTWNKTTNEWDIRPSEFTVWLNRRTVKYTITPIYEDLWNKTSGVPVGVNIHESEDNGGYGVPYYGLVTGIADRLGNRIEYQYCDFEKGPSPQDDPDGCAECSQNCNEKGQLKSLKLITSSGEVAWTLVYIHRAFEDQNSINYRGYDRELWSVHRLHSILVYKGDITVPSGCFTLDSSLFTNATSVEAMDGIDAASIFGLPSNWTMDARYTHNGRGYNGLNKDGPQDIAYDPSCRSDPLFAGASDAFNPLLMKTTVTNRKQGESSGQYEVLSQSSRLYRYGAVSDHVGSRNDGLELKGIYNDQTITTLAKDLQEYYDLDVLKNTSKPSHGNVTFDQDYIYYTPDSTFTTGSDSFTYKIGSNASATTSSATVNIIVTTSQTPMPVNDSMKVVIQSVGNRLDVLANDYNPGHDLRITGVSSPIAPKNGTVTFDDNYLYYTTNGSTIPGSDLFNYTVENSAGVSFVSNVSLQIGTWGDGDPIPIATNDKVYVCANSVNNRIVVLANDYNPVRYALKNDGLPYIDERDTPFVPPVDHVENLTVNYLLRLQDKSDYHDHDDQVPVRNETSGGYKKYPFSSLAELSFKDNTCDLDPYPAADALISFMHEDTSRTFSHPIGKQIMDDRRPSSGNNGRFYLYNFIKYPDSFADDEIPDLYNDNYWPDQQQMRYPHRIDKKNGDFVAPPRDQPFFITVIDTLINSTDSLDHGYNPVSFQGLKSRRIVKMNCNGYILEDTTWSFENNNGHIVNHTGFSEQFFYDDNGRLTERRSKGWSSEENQPPTIGADPEHNGLISVFEYDSHGELSATGIKKGNGTDQPVYYLQRFEHGNDSHPELITKHVKFSVPTTNNQSNDGEITETIYEFNTSKSDDPKDWPITNTTKLQPAVPRTLGGELYRAVDITISDENGNIVWHLYGNFDAAGSPAVEFYGDYYQYDSYGRKILEVIDANSFYTFPKGYTRLPSTSSALNLTTSFEYDDRGSLVKVVYPSGLEKHVIIKRQNDLVYTWEYTDVKWDGSSWKVLSPVVITCMQQQLQWSKTVFLNETWHPGCPNGNENYSVISISNMSYDIQGRLIEEKTQDKSGDNIVSARISYDGWNQIARQRDPDGTITRNVYDALGRQWKKFSGTRDLNEVWGNAPSISPPEDHQYDILSYSCFENDDNLMLAEKNYYGVGITDAGKLIATRNYREKPINQYFEVDEHGDPIPGPNNEDSIGWTTNNSYDWRMRQVVVTENDMSGQPLKQTFTWYDNFDKVRLVAEYGSQLNPVPSAVDPRYLPPGWNLSSQNISAILSASVKPVSLTETIYNARVLVQETRRYNVSSGTSMLYLGGSTFYDRNKKTVEQRSSNAPLTRHVYDAKGRETSMSTLVNVTGNWVEITRATMTYDYNDKCIKTVQWDRKHNAPITDLILVDGVDGNSVKTYTYTWYDKSGKVNYTADYGTNSATYTTGDDPYPACPVEYPDDPPVPFPDGVRVTHYGYDDASRTNATFNPDGTVTRTEFNGLGKTLLTTENADDANVANRRYTAYQYNDIGRLVKMAAVLPNHYGVDNQPGIANWSDVNWSVADGSLQVTETVYGGKVVDGKLKELTFDGLNDYVEIQNSDFYRSQLSNTFSVSAWFKADDTVREQSIVDMGNVSGSGWRIYLNQSSLKFDTTGIIIIEDQQGREPS